VGAAGLLVLHLIGVGEWWAAAARGGAYLVGVVVGMGTIVIIGHLAGLRLVVGLLELQPNAVVSGRGQQ
jgi:hypothetical protein